jgi:hypothetical protein
MAHAVDGDGKPFEKTRGFNLALLTQRKDQYAEAADYWRRYLASDVQSEWAARARRSLKFCEMQLHLVASAWRFCRLERAIARSERAKLIEARAEPSDWSIVFRLALRHLGRRHFSLILRRDLPAQPSNKRDEAQKIVSAVLIYYAAQADRVESWSVALGGLQIYSHILRH